MTCVFHVTVPAELPVITREHFNRWYKLRSYYIVNKLADLPVQVLATATFTLVVYHMTGQIPELSRVGLFVMMCIIVSLVAQTIGLIVGTSLNMQVCSSISLFSSDMTLYSQIFQSKMYYMLLRWGKPRI